MIIQSKDYANGLRGKVWLDEGADCEPEGDSRAVKIFVFHRRYQNPAGKWCKDQAAMESWARCVGKLWEEFPLYLYDHSGTTYRVGMNGNPFNCPWDSGRVGSIFLCKAEWGGYRKPGASAARLKAAEGVAETYTQWANGEVYGFSLTCAGETVDSCGGFIGLDSAIEAMDEAATPAMDEAASAIARDIEEARPDLRA